MTVVNYFPSPCYEQGVFFDQKEKICIILTSRCIMKLVNQKGDTMFINKSGEFKGLYLGSINIEKASDITKIGYDSKFEGTASSERMDKQEQTLIQKGLNFKPFMKYGYFNDNHGKGTCVAEAIGKKAWYNQTTNSWMVKGRFLPYVQRAKELVDLAKSFMHNDSEMQVRLSVEGKVKDISEDGKIVKKADIYRVAVTLDPINVDTGIMLLAKAIGQEEQGTIGLDLSPEDEERLLLVGRLAKSMNIGLDLAAEYYDKYSLKLNK